MATCCRFIVYFISAYLKFAETNLRNNFAYKRNLVLNEAYVLLEDIGIGAMCVLSYVISVCCETKMYMLLLEKSHAVFKLNVSP